MYLFPCASPLLFIFLDLVTQNDKLLLVGRDLFRLPSLALLLKQCPVGCEYPLGMETTASLGSLCQCLTTLGVKKGWVFPFFFFFNYFWTEFHVLICVSCHWALLRGGWVPFFFIASGNLLLLIKKCPWVLQAKQTQFSQPPKTQTSTMSTSKLLSKKGVWQNQPAADFWRYTMELLIFFAGIIAF